MSLADEILLLVDKTERNLKIAENFSGEFVVPVLNEWRYGARHIVTSVLFDGGDEERKNRWGIGAAPITTHVTSY